MNDLALHLLDIVQNSLSAGASLIRMLIHENPQENILRFEVEDNGKGMTPEQVARLSDPFFTSRTTRKVGLGVPLLRQSAEQSGGGLSVTSTLGKGTALRAWFAYDHIDRPPLGDIPNAVVLLVSANPQVDFEYEYRYNQNVYVFSTVEVKDVLDGIPLNDVKIVRMLQEMITENQNDIKV